MEQIHGAADEAGASTEDKADLPAARQVMVAAAAGAAVLTIVMLLMLLAVRQGSPTNAIKPVSHPKNIAPEAYKRYILVNNYAAREGPGAPGAREILIEGYVENAGALTVASADLRCFFPIHSGGQRAIDLPLVVDTRLDEVGDGPLAPYSTRDFSVRIGEFPDGLAPEILRVEVVKVRLSSS